MCSLEGELAFLKPVHKADLPQAEASPRNGGCRVNKSVLIIGPGLVKHTQETAQETSQCSRFRSGTLRNLAYAIVDWFAGAVS